MFILKCFAIFGFGTCSMLFPLIKDVTYNLETINGNVRRKKNRSKILNRFAQFLQFNSKLLQLILCNERYQILYNQMDKSRSPLLFFYRLIHDFPHFSRIIFLIILFYNIAGICAMMLMKMKMVKLLWIMSWLNREFILFNKLFFSNFFLRQGTILWT